MSALAMEAGRAGMVLRNPSTAYLLAHQVCGLHAFLRSLVYKNIVGGPPLLI